MKHISSVASLAAKTFGPVAFYRMVADLWEGKTYLSWQDWEEFFSLAEEYGLTSCTIDAAGKRHPLYPDIEYALLAQWRDVKAARSQGMTADRYHHTRNEHFTLEAQNFRAKQDAIAVQKRAAVEQGRKPAGRKVRAKNVVPWYSD